MTGDPIFSIILPFELTNGNTGRTKTLGSYYTHRERKSLERRLRVAGLVRQPFPQPVTIHLTRILGHRQRFWDSDSGLRGNSKELIDAMVACGWFADDNMDWIKETRFFQAKGDGPAIKVEIFAATTP